MAVGITGSLDCPVVRALQPANAGTEDPWLASIDCQSPPGALCNTLLSTRSAAGVRWRWSEVADSGGYKLYRALAKQTMPGVVDGIAWLPELEIPLAAEPLVCYRLAAVSCGGDGPP